MAVAANNLVCDECSQDDDEHLLVTILSTGRRMSYTVPSFPVITTQLCEVKYQLVDDNQIYDGYIRDCPGLVRPYPSLLKVCSNYTKAFTVDAEEFDRCLPLAGKTLYKGEYGEQVLVFWNWKWQDSAPRAPEDDNSDGKDSDEGCCSDSEGGDDTDTESDGDAFDSTLITHSVIFKCIGATKDNQSQEVLAMVAQKLKKQEQVDVRLRKEPNNPKDSRAIAFDCKLTSKWERIGYVVTEALNSVHHEMDIDSINSVQFAWVKFITHWSRSGPGWYCGIKITKRGEWPKEVVQCGSTV
jgi:hypothetical protein